MAFLRPPHPAPLLTHPPHASPSSPASLLVHSSSDPCRPGRASYTASIAASLAGMPSQVEVLERWQRAAPQPRGQVSAAVVGDLGAAEVEPLELRQRFSLRRRRICRRRRHEGGEALVAEWVASEIKLSSAGRRRKAGARATRPASPMAALIR